MWIIYLFQSLKSIPLVSEMEHHFIKLQKRKINQWDLYYHFLAEAEISKQEDIQHCAQQRTGFTSHEGDMTLRITSTPSPDKFSWCLQKVLRCWFTFESQLDIEFNASSLMWTLKLFSFFHAAMTTQWPSQHQLGTQNSVKRFLKCTFILCVKLIQLQKSS